jgi:hypothetical protein
MIKELLATLFVFLSLWGAEQPALAQQESVQTQQKEIPFDTDRGIWLEDTDGDTFPDLTEELTETDPYDANDYPGRDAQEEALSEGPSIALQGGFSAPECLPGYRQANPRLCISELPHDQMLYRAAVTFCRDRFGRIATLEDLTYLYFSTALDGAYNPIGKWIGNITADDNILCGNRNITFNNDPDIVNFDGTCRRSAFGASERRSRQFWCAHDDNADPDD